MQKSNIINSVLYYMIKYDVIYQGMMIFDDPFYYLVMWYMRYVILSVGNSDS